jgi:glycosyltransferase involved in cell wall biosynthesis
MTKYPPYLIQHIQLEEGFRVVSDRLTAGSNHYLVFWWKEVPLGDLYFILEKDFESTQLKKKIADIIKPAIKFYDVRQELDKYDYEKAILDDGLVFVNMMNAVLSNQQTYKLPNYVDLSVVICTRNRSNQLKSCLDSLQSLVCQPKEIVVVDNAPADDSTKKLVEQYKKVTYCLEQRPGLDIARNTGAYKASCPVIAYVDDDVSIHPLWVYRTWETFLNADITAMTGLVIASSLDTEAQQIFELHWSFNRGYVDKIYDQKYFNKNASYAPQVWEIGAGANMAFRKSVLDETGYFDERLDVGAAGCSGDSEIWYRILAKGFDIHYNPRAVVYHEHRKDTAGLQKQIFNYMRGHVVAALIQDTQNKNLGYRKYILKDLSKYYLLLLRQGFPRYRFRYQTLLSEIRGIISGLLYFKKHKNTSASNIKPLL